jgi:hypothetical protein
MIAIEHARLLGREVDVVASPVERVDPPKQRLVHEDRVPVLGENRRELALDRLEGIVGVRTGEIEEDAADALQPPSAALQGRERVVERRLAGISGDALDLAPLLVQRGFESGAKVLGRDRFERRDPVRGRPIAEQGIRGKRGLRCRHGSGRFSFQG